MPWSPTRLRHGADPDPQVGGHPGHPVILDEQDGEAVVEHVLLDLKRRGGLGRGQRCQGGYRTGEDNDQRDSHGLSPVPNSGRFSHEPALPFFVNTATLAT